MKEHYLHISYIGQAKDESLKFGDALVTVREGSNVLSKLREELNAGMKYKEFPIIMSISVLPKELYDILVDKEEKQ